MAAAAAALAGLLAAACGGGGSKGGDSNPSAAASAAKAGGALEVIVVTDMAKIDPFGALSNYYTENSRLNAVYDSLFYSEPKTGKAIAQIGESLTPDATGAVWTLKIKPNVKFTDDTPYDAAAVKWFWDEHKNPERRSIVAGSAAAIDKTEVVDPLTLRVTLKAPNANFDRVVASSLAFIGSPTALQKDPVAFATKPVGAGPFVMTEWVRDSHMTLTKNPKYWQGADKPALDKVTFRVLSDSEQALNAVATGQRDLKVTGSATDAAKAQAKGLGTVSVSVIVGEAVAFNNAKPPFDDPRARKAVALALDANEINKVAFNGQGVPTNSLFPAGSPLVAADAPAVPSANRVEAQRLLDELAAEGKPLSFTYLLPQNNQATRTGEYIQSQLIGLKNIKVTVQPMAIVAFTQAVRINRAYEAALYNWMISDIEPMGYSYMHSTSPTNFLGYKNQAVDAALDQGRKTSDPDQRRTAYTAMAAQAAKDIPIWPYQEGRLTVFHGNSVAGLVLSNDGMMLMDRLGRRS
ncbi:ABC transporter substrate-binding protein [Yinghuangia soli]|uniref:ABC transporter substrate-binding protein n=1 Tax=Yinghuangia soli TaxID=2908204 RepID=A0AA41Q8A0_9ACTN|nr:ABC transporter substrate-binding protein [Yinghuangia soli]MCF2532032.1 ABC transporter substrate-binding protein [Yinghuangia soli]